LTKNRRYESTYDALNDHRIAQAVENNQPITIGMDAYGPQPIEWARDRPPQVWAWISWRDGPATRIPAVADGWNDRIVIVGFEAPGGRRTVVVWRNAVTRRTTKTPPASP
jgi:hypothetical protein